MIFYGSAMGAPVGSETTIFSYVNTGQVRYLRSVAISSNIQSCWNVYKNSAVIFQRRIGSADPDYQDNLYNNKLEIGDVIEIKAEPNKFNISSQFTTSATITDTAEDDDIIINVNVIEVEQRALGVVMDKSRINGVVIRELKNNGSVIEKTAIGGSVNLKSEKNGIITKRTEIVGYIECR